MHGSGQFAGAAIDGFLAVVLDGPAAAITGPSLGVGLHGRFQGRVLVARLALLVSRNKPLRRPWRQPRLGESHGTTGSRYQPGRVMGKVANATPAGPRRGLASRSGHGRDDQNIFRQNCPRISLSVVFDLFVAQSTSRASGFLSYGARAEAAGSAGSSTCDGH